MTSTEIDLIQVAALITFLAAWPGLASVWLHVRSLGERIDDLESLRLLDAAESSRIHEEMSELRRGVTVLIAQLRRRGDTPEWTPPAPSSAPPAGSQRAETDRLVDLWQRIEEKFDMDEMADLAFRLGLPESRADSSGAMARDLVNAAKRRDKLDKLVALCRSERPTGGF